MPTGKTRARGPLRKKRRREESLESQSVEKDDIGANSCVPVAKKVSVE